MSANVPSSILVATDFSAGARLAVERAVRLALAINADLRLVHVLAGNLLDELRRWLGRDETTGLPAGHIGPADQVHSEAQAALSALVSELTTGTAGSPRLSTELLAGAVLGELERASARADLLVLGARGHGRLRHLLLGTTAERLLHRAARPILVVRQPALTDYRHALVAVDFSPFSAHALALARRLAPTARLTLLHAFELPFEERLRRAGVTEDVLARGRAAARAEAEQRLAELATAAALPPGWQMRLEPGTPAEVVVEQAEQLDCDLVAVGKQGRSAAERLLLGSVSAHVLGESTRDVLVATLP